MGRQWKQEKSCQQYGDDTFADIHGDYQCRRPWAKCTQDVGSAGLSAALRTGVHITKKLTYKYATWYRAEQVADDDGD
jgi:hypothetical protein